MAFQITSGQISENTTYSVTGVGSVTYNTVVYVAPTTFLGVRGVNTFIATGSPVVYENTDIRSSSISLVFPNESKHDNPTLVKALDVSLQLPKMYKNEITLINSLGVSLLLQNKFLSDPTTKISSLEIGVDRKGFLTIPSKRKTLPYTSTPLPSEDILPIMIGQSNMQGAGGNPSLAPVVGSFGKEYKFLTNTVATLVEPTGEAISGFQTGSGLQSAFAVQYNTLTGKNVCVAKHSKGGTGSGDWATTLTPASISLLQAATSLPAYRKIVVYFQGEANSSSVTEASRQAYGNEIKSTIAQYRAVYPLIPFFFIKTSSTNTSPSSDVLFLNTAIDEICETVPYCYVGFDAYPYYSAIYKSDAQHFNQTTLNLIGVGLANTVNNILFKQV